MTQPENNREASATIRGYIYQFDATIRKILASSSGISCTIEDVEDFDIHSPDLSSYFQCKYYAAQKLTSSTLRDAILPMLKNYVGLDNSERDNKRYHLYGYFKETSYENSILSVDILKSILLRRESIKNDSGKKHTKLLMFKKKLAQQIMTLQGLLLSFH